MRLCSLLKAKCPLYDYFVCSHVTDKLKLDHQNTFGSSSLTPCCDVVPPAVLMQHLLDTCVTVANEISSPRVCYNLYVLALCCRVLTTPVRISESPNSSEVNTKYLNKLCQMKVSCN